MTIKTSIQVSRTWKTDFIQGLALPSDQKPLVKQAIANEVDWFVRLKDDHESHTVSRLNKLNALISYYGDEGMISFDRFWSYRHQFFQWLLAA